MFIVADLVSLRMQYQANRILILNVKYFMIVENNNGKMDFKSSDKHKLFDVYYVPIQSLWTKMKEQVN